MREYPGSYTCTCNGGYAGDGKTCTDVDECQEGTAGCDPNATCQNTPGSFTCTCNAGYAGTGTVCTDVDECQAGTAGCDPNAKCQNTPGSFTCTCNQGYAGDGHTCAASAGGAPGEVSIDGGADTTSSTSVTLYLQEPGNLLQNPGGETGDLSGWQILSSGGDGWASGKGDPVIQLFGALHFTTSFGWDGRSQLLDLTTLGFTQQELDAAPPITVREWYHGGGYSTADSYYLGVELRDTNGTVLASYNKGTQASPTVTNATWQMATQTFSGYGTGLRYVYFEDGGQDTEFWAGYYGAAMDAASVVVGSGVQVRFSNDNASWSAWQPFAPTMSWTLDAASGTKTVYVQFQDGNGPWPTASDTITLQ